MDIESGLFSVVDGIFDNLGGDLSGSTVFGSAAVNVPEPATGVLLALGLLGIRTAATPRLSRMR